LEVKLRLAEEEQRRQAIIFEQQQVERMSQMRDEYSGAAPRSGRWDWARFPPDPEETPRRSSRRSSRR